MALIKAVRGKAGTLVLDPRSTYTGPTYTPSTVDNFVAMNDRRLPWESLGKKVNGRVGVKAMTAKAALKAVGMDFTVEKFPIVIEDEFHTPIPNMFATFYDTKEGERIPMGVVGDRYSVTQPHEGLEFLDHVISNVDGANYSGIWTMREKRQIGVTIEFPDHIVIDPGGAADVCDLYGLGVNSFDGSTAFQFAVESNRLWCMNQVFPHLARAQRGFTLKHNSGIQAKIHDAQRAIGVTYDYATELDRIANAMYAKRISTDGMVKLAKSLFPTDKSMKPLAIERQAERQQGLIDLFLESPTNANITGTAWGAFNAALEYADWGRRVRGTGDEAERNRAVGTMVGRTTAIMTKAWDVLSDGIAPRPRRKVSALSR